jgi:L-ascorbate metabolism protein UlaG (beta-lactamase superfamily)
MALIGEDGVDLALLPIGDNYTMGPEDALRAVKLIHPKMVVPIHFGTFGLIEQDAAAWGRDVSVQTSTAPHILKPGDWVTVRV